MYRATSIVTSVTRLQQAERKREIYQLRQTTFADWNQRIAISIGLPWRYFVDVWLDLDGQPASSNQCYALLETVVWFILHVVPRFFFYQQLSATYTLARMLIGRIILKLHYSWNLFNLFDFLLNNDSEKQLLCANVQVLINYIQRKTKSVLFYETCVGIFQNYVFLLENTRTVNDPNSFGKHFVLKNRGTFTRWNFLYP